MTRSATPRSQSPRLHPDTSALDLHATGALDPIASLLVESHAALCPRCRSRISAMEAVGGALLEDLAPVPLGADALALVLARIDAEAAAAEPETTLAFHRETARLPEALRDLARRASQGRGWRPMAPGLKGVDLFPARGAGPATEARLLRIKPGHGIARHTHRGIEATLVLTGAFSDEAGHYGPGDLLVVDASATHRPIAAEGEVCLALTVTDAPPIFTGMLGLAQRLYQGLRGTP